MELNRIEYAVAGSGNVTRSLERNAELQLTLNKKDYVPGEDIEISIKAPYAGAGLITIERDKVFTHQWFKTDTLASVQKIRLPKDFEGNGYVSVQFIRDPGSDEIFMSPMSYGAVPFATSLAARSNQLTLTAPELVKPGERLTMKLTRRPSRRAWWCLPSTRASCRWRATRRPIRSRCSSRSACWKCAPRRSST